MIHYHIDCTDCYRTIRNHVDSYPCEGNWILDELDSWGYKGTYNGRRIGGWLRANSLETLEYRCGEMTFDYQDLIKNIIHANDITKRLKKEIGIEYIPNREVVDFSRVIGYLQTNITNPLKAEIATLRNKLKELEQEEKGESEEDFNEMREIINRRVKDYGRRS